MFEEVKKYLTRNICCNSSLWRISVLAYTFQVSRTNEVFQDFQWNGNSKISTKRHSLERTLHQYLQYPNPKFGPVKDAKVSRPHELFQDQQWNFQEHKIHLSRNIIQLFFFFFFDQLIVRPFSNFMIRDTYLIHLSCSITLNKRLLSKKIRTQHCVA